ncbi:MAG TPA: class III extradiol ring-cleavage dioxygenase, partial [Chroococcidiopsis sp.]
LYQLKYPAPGAPELAARVMALLTKAGFAPQIDRDRGLDHGAWEPLMLMYPEADIPVTQLSIQPHLGTAHHVQLGRALAALKDEGVLIVASGTATHNLRALSADHNAPVLDWVVEFDQWLAKAIASADLDALLDYRRQAPHARQSHPSEEHFLPLFVALGAGGDRPHATQLHSSFQHGALSMAAYAFAA